MARLLGLQLDPSGGAAVEALAREGDDQRFRFSRPLVRKPNCNFSYAGLKTAVRLAINAELKGPPSEADRQVRPIEDEACLHELLCCQELIGLQLTEIFAQFLSALKHLCLAQPFCGVPRMQG